MTVATRSDRDESTPTLARGAITPEMARQLTSLAPDEVPNRYLSGDDWMDPRYTRLREAFATLYCDELRGEPHPYGAKDPASIVTHWSREWEYPWAVLNAELSLSAKGRPWRVLDLGCGGSPLLILLARAGCACTGVDLNFRSATGRNNLRGFVDDPGVLFPEITWCVESMDSLSAPDASMDRVFCVSVLEHVHPDVARGTFKEISRVLTPGGLAIITTDVDGAHRTLSSSYAELIAMAVEFGLALKGKSDDAPPRDRPGTYDVVGFVLEQR